MHPSWTLGFLLLSLALLCGSAQASWLGDVGDGFKEVGHDIEDGVKTVGHEVQSGWNTVKHGVESGWHEVTTDAQITAKWMTTRVPGITTYAGQAYNRMYNAVKSADPLALANPLFMLGVKLCAVEPGLSQYFGPGAEDDLIARVLLDGSLEAALRRAVYSCVMKKGNTCADDKKILEQYLGDAYNYHKSHSGSQAGSTVGSRIAQAARASAGKSGSKSQYPAHAHAQYPQPTPAPANEQHAAPNKAHASSYDNTYGERNYSYSDPFENVPAFHLADDEWPLY
ncbi:hypothetical protein RI367_007132 [Sorochytrium milnesiophthora]